MTAIATYSSVANRRMFVSQFRLGWLLSLVIYSLFAAVVFVVHGSEPVLGIDHIYYLRIADNILRLHPDGAYWKSYDLIHPLGTVLAYLHGFTGSHIVSLKLLLAGMTVLALLAFELFIGFVSDAKWKSILFAVLSGLFVTFGASFWGYTDFAASLPRTAVIPIMLCAVWFWFFREGSLLKFAVIPVLVAGSIVSLSTYYLVAVLVLMEVWDWAVRRRFRFDRRLLWFVVSLAGAQFVRMETEHFGLGLNSNLVALVIPITGVAMLDPTTAWKIELIAFPWEHMPLPLTTIATMAASYGFIFVVSLLGAIAAFRRGLTALDRSMLVMVGAILAFSYGPQTLLWIARQFLPIYPFGIEEVRAINLIMIPSLYFSFRLFDGLWRSGKPKHSRPLALAVVLLLVLQPVMLVRLLPEHVRLGIVEAAISAGLIREEDSLRLLYARHFLGLDQGDTRFYYPARGVIQWLNQNVAPNTRVLTTLNEILLADVESIGTFNGVLSNAITAPGRKVWADSVGEVNEAVSSRDLARVEAVARKYGAQLAIVPWPVPSALYQDDHYSIVRVGT